jgi:HaeII restriction endonuclease
MANDAKTALDKIIQKGRIHLYKPVQIAEILYHDRLELANFDLANPNTYRNISKQWRDVITTRLVGRISTSSQKYQDNLFDVNAMPPSLLIELAKTNREQNGIIENYIYHRFQQRLQDVIDAHAYLITSTTDTFLLHDFLDFFERKAGLKRSVDKAFEIVVYALFSTLVSELQAQVSLTLNNPDPQILVDFSQFIEYVLGLQDVDVSVTVPASMYRGGVTNAADRGLDIITNFGPSVQVKHLRLDESLAEDISEGVAVNDIVIVCKTAEGQVIHSILNQVGLGIRGIVTQDDLEKWYDLCQTKYAQRMGTPLLNNLAVEFAQEFPMLGQLQSFMANRGYKADKLKGEYLV